MPRIGTTTQALQLTAFLKHTGYEAAYIEMNKQDYIWGTVNLYPDCHIGDTPGTANFNGIQLFSQNHLIELMSEGTGYDYLICDYGTIQSSFFRQKDFESNGVKIIVAGAKPNEAFLTERMLKNKAFDDAIYSFNFIGEIDRENVLIMMREKADKTVFAPYMPDPFLIIPPTDTASFFYSVMDLVIDMLERRR